MKHHPIIVDRTPLRIIFYPDKVRYFIGKIDCGFHGYNSKIGKILLEWKEETKRKC